jgi:hypothetical protein
MAEVLAILLFCIIKLKYPAAHAISICIKAARLHQHDEVEVTVRGYHEMTLRVSAAKKMSRVCTETDYASEGKISTDAWTSVFKLAIYNNCPGTSLNKSLSLTLIYPPKF